MTDQLIPPNVPVETTPPLPLAPRPSHSLWPVLLGAILVFFLATVLGGSYYLSKLKKEINSSPLPSPSLAPSPTPTPSPTPSATPSATPKPSAKSTGTPKPSPTPTPTPTVSLPTLDIRFGNPAANVKQTIDEGLGDGRVINREYTSIQVGEFDEVKSSYSPKVTVCFHVVSSDEVKGEKVGYTMTTDDKITVEGTLSQYGKLEAGRLYDFCHDVTGDLGTHVVKLNINNTKSLAESNINNNFARLEYKNLADNIAPNFSLSSPYQTDSKTCVKPLYLSDNVTPTASLIVESKVGSGSYTKDNPQELCLEGVSGTSQTVSYRATDARGNNLVQSLTFNLF